MVRRYYDLPSLTSLAIFEATGRHLSFKLAAKELNVTPGAVSKQIRAVEEQLGVALYVRGQHGIALTTDGEDLYAVLASGFSKAADVVRTIRRGDRTRNVTIACTDAFAMLWLIPRMPDFWKRFPDIMVDHLISDNARDYKRAEIELRVRYGLGSWADESAELLFDDTIYPVCGPNFARLYPDATPALLARLPLLHLDWVDPDWPDWDEVLRRAQIPHGSMKGRRFGKFSVALQAAQADQGVAVGWERLVRSQVEEGKLVRFTDLELSAPGSYYLTWSDNRLLSPAGEVLRNWIRELASFERPKRT